MNIDWSKAPEWAGVVVSDTDGRLFFVKQFGGESPRMPVDDERDWGRRANMTGNHGWKLVESRPVPWTGEGLPPVGTVCEIIEGDEVCWDDSSRHLIGERCTVITAFKNSLGQGVCVVELGSGQCECQIPETLRPIRTAEQIVAEERMACAEECHNLIFPEGKWHKLDESAKEAWSAIYDAGYRKQEQK